MKRTTLTQIFAVIIIAFISSSNLNAATYTTTSNGTWNDVAGVWSLDGGATPCFCSPGTPSLGNDIVVNHNIALTSNIVINVASVLTVNPTGSLNGTFDVYTWNPGSTINNFGVMDIVRLIADLSATVNITNGILNCSGQLHITNGIVNMDNALVQCGGPQIQALGTLNIANGSKVFGYTSNITNYGLINIGTGCCLQSNGNIRNRPTGVITGDGSVNSGGNINNQGVIDVLIRWCATGAGVGMLSAEDCTNSDAICNAITILPVELVSFTADAIDKDYIELNWATASENNSSHFELYSSQDGQNWKEVGTVESVGTSQEMNYYSFADYNVVYGTTYYKLVQFDFDNRTEEFEVISVSVEGEEVEISVYPNPIKNFETLTITNIEESAGQIHILNISGQIIATEAIDGNMTTAKIQISNLLPGIYFVNVEQLGTFKTKRLVITE